MGNRSEPVAGQCPGPDGLTISIIRAVDAEHRHIRVP